MADTANTRIGVAQLFVVHLIQGLSNPDYEARQLIKIAQERWLAR